MSDPEEKSFRLKINPHGMFGLIAVGVMIFIAFHRNWQIPWSFFVFAVLLYSIAVIALSIAIEISTRNALRRRDKAITEGRDFRDSEEDYRFELFRFLMGSHAAFLFLALSLSLDFETFGVSIGLFFASIGGGLAIPFLLFKRG
jgi:hypothetical protein